MGWLQRSWRRITYLHLTCLLSWALCVVSTGAASEVRMLPGEPVWPTILRLSVLFALTLFVSHRYREFWELIHDAFVRSQAHLFVTGLMVVVAMAMYGSVFVLKQIGWAVLFSPALLVAQVVFSLFACAGRGFDRLMWVGLALLGLQGAAGHPHESIWGGLFVAATVAGYVFSHFHELLSRYGSEERSGVGGAIGAALVFALIALVAFTGIYHTMPRAYGLTGEYTITNAVGSHHGSGHPGGEEDPSGPGVDGTWVRWLLNGGTIAVGAILLVMVLRALRAGGTKKEEEEPEHEDAEGTLVEDLPAVPVATRRKTMLKTPRALVILSYNSLPEKLRPHGVDRAPSQTPAEYAEAVVRKRPQTAESVSRLTQIFRKAKYSLDPVSKQDVDDAYALVTRIAEGFGGP